MIGMYCQGTHHSLDGLCPECEQLHLYAMGRIDKCPYQSDKPTCAKCPIHCYKPAMREQIRQVMRYAGPRMLFAHPSLAMWHYLDEITKKVASKAETKKRRE